ncbi:hypothetical protein BDR05DRAFT_946975 [Suillus weaverae]|nr:hypothetical protein BDR05DRAFT_946975 [Suillus weaverae]
MASIAFNKLEAAATEQTVINKEAASNQKLIIDMLQSTHEKIDHQAILITQCGLGQQSQSVLHDIQPLEISYLHVKGLHLYLVNPLATFKTIEQARAVEVLSCGNPHVLIVMPTGAGKSAIYASPGYAVKASNLLWAIVIDEVRDVLIASDYCHAFKMLLKITNLAVQVTLLMGTLSPCSEVALLQTLRMDPMYIHKTQMPMHHLEIQYHVRCTQKEDIDDNILSTALSHTLQPHERSIIFVLTTTCCEKLTEMSGFLIYHGQLNDEGRKTAMRKWKLGKSQWIIGTLAMAQGIDITSIHIIVNREISWLSTDQHGDKQDKAMVDFMSPQTCHCRTVFLFLDGIDQTCLTMLQTELCDVCISNVHLVRQHQQFYSSPSGSRLKVLPQPQPGTPSRALIKPTELQTHGLPTPISHHTTGITLHQAPPSPMPHGEDQSSSEDSDDDVPPSPASFPQRIMLFGYQQACPSKHSAFRADSQLSFAPGHQPAPQAWTDIPRAQPNVILGEGLPVTYMGKEQQIGRWCKMHVLKCSLAKVEIQQLRNQRLQEDSDPEDLYERPEKAKAKTEPKEEENN